VRKKKAAVFIVFDGIEGGRGTISLAQHKQKGKRGRGPWVGGENPVATMNGTNKLRAEERENRGVEIFASRKEEDKEPLVSSGRIQEPDLRIGSRRRRGRRKGGAEELPPA